MKKYYFGLIIIYILIYILPLGARPMLTPDEFRYGEIPREMIETGKLGCSKTYRSPLF